MSHETAKQILDLERNRVPVGFRNITELNAGQAFNIKHLDDLFHLLSDTLYGRWTLFHSRFPVAVRAQLME